MASKTKRLNWDKVWGRMEELASTPLLWRAGQEKSISWIARQLQEQPGVLVADEVGLGKTRLAIALAVCVAACGGRVAILIPPGLTFQWRDEELLAFLKQAQESGPGWVPATIASRVLRTYPDLFNGGGTNPGYPVSEHAPLVFMSHRFSVPQRLSAVRRDEFWGLPFALKKALVGDGRKVRNAGKLELPLAQHAAVNWLAENISIDLQHQVTDGVLTAVSTAVFDDPAAKILFGNLIGELVGDFDLVIIDEAHKSRAGTDPDADAAKALPRKKQNQRSLLNACLAHILMRPGSASQSAKRLALTATPMEMRAEQWRDIFHRLNLPPERIHALDRTVQDYAAAVTGMRSGTPSEVERLSTSGHAFRDALKPIVTRRIWRDHPQVKKFAERMGRQDAAHPHRRTHPVSVSLMQLQPEERLQLACAEALGAASRGLATDAVLKHAGSHHAQALPLVSELLLAENKGGQQAVAGSATPQSIAEAAKRVRQAFWSTAIRDLSRRLGPVADKPAWSLQWHPKVRQAIKLIEELTARNEKVLVFAEFLVPMEALDRALNIRYYLRQIRASKPMPLPVGLKIDDPDLLRWLDDPELGFTPEHKDSFRENAIQLGREYASDRAVLRDLCQATVSAFFATLSPAPVRLGSNLLDALVTWLVQELCVNEQLSTVSEKDGREQVRYAVELLLMELMDTDPAGSSDNDDVSAERPFDWGAAIRELISELETDANGRHVFRISPFSQRIHGETKSSTRRVRQGNFNNPQLNPKVLIGQSSVISEGLNLHRACRSVVMLHLNWNPGRIEQQIGRVDRQGSAWMRDFENWAGAASASDAPHIDIYTIALEGTYDAFRTAVINERAKVLRAQLFGEILPLEQLLRLPEDAQAVIGAINIDFRP